MRESGSARWRMLSSTVAQAVELTVSPSLPHLTLFRVSMRVAEQQSGELTIGKSWLVLRLLPDHIGGERMVKSRGEERGRGKEVSKLRLGGLGDLSPGTSHLRRPEAAGRTSSLVVRPRPIDLLTKLRNDAHRFLAVLTNLLHLLFHSACRCALLLRSVAAMHLSRLQISTCRETRHPNDHCFM